MDRYNDQIPKTSSQTDLKKYFKIGVVVFSPIVLLLTYFLFGWFLTWSMLPKLIASAPVFYPQADKTFITNDPCAPPCWYGLGPDKSTLEEFYVTLQKLDFIHIDNTTENITTQHYHYSTILEVVFYCSYAEIPCGRAIFFEGILKELDPNIYYSLSFESTVNHLGAPDFISYGPYGVEAGGCGLNLFWEGKGIVVNNLNVIDDAQCLALYNGNGIDPNTMVEYISYVSSDLSKDWNWKFGNTWPGFESREIWPTPSGNSN